MTGSPTAFITSLLTTVEYHQNSPKSFTADVPWATTGTRQVPIHGLDTNCSQVFKFHHISANKPEKNPLNSSQQDNKHHCFKLEAELNTHVVSEKLTAESRGFLCCTSTTACIFTYGCIFFKGFILFISSCFISLSQFCCLPENPKVCISLIRTNFQKKNILIICGGSHYFNLS